MINFYKDQVKQLKAKVKAHAELGNELKVTHLNKEIANYERAIRQSEPAKPTGVDAYLS